MTPTMKKILKSWLLAAALCFCVTAAAERPVLIHSHNDYCRRAPFWQAYAQGVYSIEADVFLHDGRLLVGHDVEDLSPDMTFESLYVEPIVTLFGRNGGRAWKDSDERLQLMVELKSATEPTSRDGFPRLRISANIPPMSVSTVIGRPIIPRTSWSASPS